MVRNDKIIQRFCDNVNREAKTEEKNDLRRAIDAFLETGEFKVSADTLSPNGVSTYRIDFVPFQKNNFNLSYDDVEEVLNEYKNFGYRCCLRTASEEIICPIHVIFQILIRVNPLADGAPYVPNEYNYTLPCFCSVIKD